MSKEVKTQSENKIVRRCQRRLYQLPKIIKRYQALLEIAKLEQDMLIKKLELYQSLKQKEVINYENNNNN